MMYTTDTMTDASGGTLGDSSLLLGKTQTPLNMDDAQDVVTLLKRIHQSAIDPDTKNHLRDLIFSYRQAPETNTLTFLRDACAALGVSITVPEKKLALEQKKETEAILPTQLGMRRPAPMFASVRADEIRISPAAVETAHNVFSESRPAVTEMPNYSEPAAPAANVPPAEIPRMPEELRETVGEEKTLPAQATTVPAAPYRDPNERINEIKRSVNEHVGNPINLIEADNDIGKEYMQALLEAMKKRNSGMPHEMTAAMDRLEKAYAAVDALIMQGGLEHAKAAHVSRATSQESVEAEIPKATASQRVAVRIAQMSEPTGRSNEVLHEQEKKEISIPVPHAHTTAPVTPALEPIIPQKGVSPINADAEPVTDQAPDSAPSGMLSVAKEKQLQDLMRATHMKEAEAAREKEATRVAAMDPLMTPEVDAGLGQLLSEWNLFKSSGFFGTGPGGKEHVLYRKLAGLPMAAVVAGRFEGATPKIRQSITDYMNGWRYEDGIMYDPAETFEHYLRKVIRHILDRQKNNT